MITISGLATLGLVLMSALLASRESDVAALERQRQLVNGRLQGQVETVARDVELMAKGYASILNGNAGVETLETGTPVTEMFSNLVTSVFRYDKAFVVGADGEMAIYRDSETMKRYKWTQPLLMPLLRKVVKTQAEYPRGDVFAGPATVEMMRLEGRPTIAAIIPINDDASKTRGGKALYLVVFRFLDGTALDTLSREQGMNGARFARSADPEANEVTFQIEATAGKEPIGFIIWTPDLPGSKVVGRLIPGLSASALIIAALLITLVFRLRKTLADLKESERTAHHRSLQDVLTELPNRAWFAKNLEASVSAARSGNSLSAVALIDLDRFKTVNDSLGHAAGDELLQAVAQRVGTLLKGDESLARLGGDEFALLFPPSNRESQSFFDLCNRIIIELSRPFSLLNGKATAEIGCSIGLATIAGSDKTASQVLHSADLALYAAKSSGRGRCVKYSASMDTDALFRESLREDLRAFLDSVDTLDNRLAPPSGAAVSRDHGIEVFYQTIHRAGHVQEVSGAEALVRWRHKKHGLLTPDKFIPIAEESGLIHRLGSFVLREACIASIHWPNQGFVAVNVSPTQLRSPGFADQVLSILDRVGMAPSRLEVEVTETALMGNDEEAVERTISRLREHGVKIALDDFGTGYSSLSHLIQFGIDRIKIDRSFVSRLDTKADGAAIISAIVTLSRNLGLATTAEGVETAGQRDFLISAGCSDLQGFMFSRPEPFPVMELARVESSRAVMMPL